MAGIKVEVDTTEEMRKTQVVGVLSRVVTVRFLVTGLRFHSRSLALSRSVVAPSRSKREVAQDLRGELLQDLSSLAYAVADVDLGRIE